MSLVLLLQRAHHGPSSRHLDRCQAKDASQGVGQRLLHQSYRRTTFVTTFVTTFALRTPHVVAMVRGEVHDGEQVFMEQLQLDRWPSCHSLCVNLSQLEAASLAPDQMITFMREIDQASKSLPMLQCLDIIDKHTESTISFDVLMGLLAKHASVLTLQAKAIGSYLYLPALQHLVLDLNPNYGKYPHQSLGQRNQYLDVSELKSLKTLYLQAPRSSHDSTGLLVTQDGPSGAYVFDLTGSPHLEHVAVQGVLFQGKLALPAGCHMHAICVGTSAQMKNHGNMSIWSLG